MLLWRTLLLVVGGFVLANAGWLAATANLNLGMALSATAGLALLAWGIFVDTVARHPLIQGVAITVLAAVIAFACFLAGYGVRDDVSYQEDALIVLGAAVHGSTVSNTLASRLDAALAYRERNPQVLLVVTGGQGPQEQVSEASAMRAYLVAHGVPAAAIVVEDRATSTEENFAFSKALLDARLPAGYTTAYVTNEFHVYRADRIAHAEGIQATHSHSATPWYFWATSYLREELAVLASWTGLG